LDAVTPDQRPLLFASLAPEHVHGISEALVAPLGLALLVVARGLARRKRRAWQAALLVLVWLVALHLQHGFGYGAIATAIVAVALLARRQDFDAPGDPASHPRLALRAFVFGSVILGYAVTALWANRVMADQPFTLGFALRETARVAYKVVGGVAIMSGDPIGPPERFPALVGSFLQFARTRDWRVAILGASESALDIYRSHGLHALYHGDEAVVDTETFSLEG